MAAPSVTAVPSLPPAAPAGAEPSATTTGRDGPEDVAARDGRARTAVVDVAPNGAPPGAALPSDGPAGPGRESPPTAAPAPLPRPPAARSARGAGGELAAVASGADAPALSSWTAVVDDARSKHPSTFFEVPVSPA